MLNFAHLLIHSPDVPEQVRSALRAAYCMEPEPDQRSEHLRTAANLLYQEEAFALECADVKELVGLGSGCCG